MNGSKVEPVGALALTTRPQSSSPSDTIAPLPFAVTLTQSPQSIKDLYTIDPGLNDTEFFVDCLDLLMVDRGWWGNGRLPPEVR